MILTNKLVSGNVTSGASICVGSYSPGSPFPGMSRVPPISPLGSPYMAAFPVPGSRDVWRESGGAPLNVEGREEESSTSPAKEAEEAEFIEDDSLSSGRRA